MATKKAGKKGMGALEAAEIGAGVLAAAAAAGAAYYFYGTKKAVQHRDAASKWAKGLKRDVLKKMKKVEKLTGKTSAALIEEAAQAYRGMEGVSKKDLDAAVEELKKNWSKVKKELEPSAEVAGAVKKAEKAVKKVVAPAKKAAKKSR